MIDFHGISIRLPRISSAALWQRVTERHGATPAWSVVSGTTLPHEPQKTKEAETGDLGRTGRVTFLTPMIGYRLLQPRCKVSLMAALSEVSSPAGEFLSSGESGPILCVFNPPCVSPSCVTIAGM